MKQCPFCGAVIEENARFCLYCMKELEEKAVIDEKSPFLTKRRIRLILICTAALLLIAVMLIILSSVGTKQTGPGGNLLDVSQMHTNTPGNNTAASSGGVSAPTVTPSPSFGNTQSIDNTPNNENTPSSLGTPSASTTPSIESTPSSGSTPSISITPSAMRTPSAVRTPSPGKTQGTGGTPSAVKTPSSDKTPTPGNTQSSSGTPSNSTPPSSQTPVEQVTYTYRDAEFYDIIPAADRANQELLAQNAVVVTGVETAAKSGVYVIPEQIDGKKVVAVMGSAFSDTQICSTVKKVIFPASIHSVWEKFQFCSNLTDMYFTGKSVVLDTYTFSLIPNKQHLTVHGASDCVCYYGSTGKSTLKERVAQFGISYQNWNIADGY